MTESRAKSLQIDLLDLIEAHGDLNVSVGLSHGLHDDEWGVVVTSRQPDVYLTNDGQVTSTR